MNQPIIVNQTGDFKFIGGPRDGQTVEVELADIVYRDGPFEYRLAIQRMEGEFPFQYVMVSAKMLKEARAHGVPE